MDSIGYLGIFVAALGAALALWGGLGHRRARALMEAATRWPEAPGKVIAADVERRGGGATANRNTYYRPLIRYTYVVSGREREGSRFRFGMTSARTRAGAEKMLAPYPPGAAIKVRYDPEYPDQSVLEPGKTGSSLLFGAIAGVLLLLAGGAIIALAVRGFFSADVSGHWHIRFEAGGAVYQGELEAVHGAGPLTISYESQNERRQAIEDCTLTRNRDRVLVRCANARMIQGAGSYSPDAFDLAFQGGSRLAGTVTSPGGAPGTATFTR